MKPFFDSAERRAALRAEAATWWRTPFLPHGCNKGKGVDCISLCAMIYLKLGLITVYQPPAYSIDGGSHLAESRLEAEIEKMGCFEKVWVRPDGDRNAVVLMGFALPGDLLVFRLARTTHHVGLVVSPGKLIQAIRGPGVCYADLPEVPLCRRVQIIYRPQEQSS